MLRTSIENMRSHRPIVQPRYDCQHCHKVFVLESRFLQHQCKQMKREEEFKSPTGQLAWHYYSMWMRNMKRMPPPATSFLTSKYFRTFINFVEFTKRVQLPKVDKFIWLMTHKTYPPTIWMNDEVYSIFLEHLDRQMPGVENASLSIQTLISYCDKHDVSIDQVFEHIPIQQIIQGLLVRKLSPWLLLHSKKFKQAFTTRATSEQQLILENLIRPDYWPARFQLEPESIKTIKRLVVEMGI